SGVLRRTEVALRASLSGCVLGRSREPSGTLMSRSRSARGTYPGAPLASGAGPCPRVWAAVDCDEWLGFLRPLALPAQPARRFSAAEPPPTSACHCSHVKPLGILH